MTEQIAALSLLFFVVFALLAVIVAVVLGVLYRAQDAARLVEAADMPAESGLERPDAGPDVNDHAGRIHGTASG
jgi:hypothetical protein